MIMVITIVIVMPVYNAGRTLRQAYAKLLLEFIDDVILIDDSHIA
jgi:glycosyltransferase involved in cell wall biosynthesis